MNKPESIPADLVFEHWRKDPDYLRAFQDLEDEFAMARMFINARSEAGLAQQELAEKMGASQTYIARLEGRKKMPSTRILNRIAKATGNRVVINFVPLVANRS